VVIVRERTCVFQWLLVALRVARVAEKVMKGVPESVKGSERGIAGLTPKDEVPTVPVLVP
jgi:hypothetical protein